MLRKPKTVDEVESRTNFYNLAKELGCDNQLVDIFQKYDALIQKSRSDGEAKQYRVLALVDIWRLFGLDDALMVDGVEILPAKPKIGK